MGNDIPVVTNHSICETAIRPRQQAAPIFRKQTPISPRFYRVTVGFFCDLVENICDLVEFMSVLAHFS